MRLLVLFLLLAATAAHARWKPQYANASPEEQAWYQRQQTTPEWRKRVGVEWYMSCRDHADTVEAEFSKRNGEWVYRLPGETNWRTIAQDIVQPDVQTPHGKAVLFIDSTGKHLGPVCFFPGGAGV